MYTTLQKVENYVQMLTFRYEISHWMAPHFASFDQMYIQTYVSQGVPVSSIPSRPNRGPNLKTTILSLLALSDSYRPRRKKD